MLLIIAIAVIVLYFFLFYVAANSQNQNKDPRSKLRGISVLIDSSQQTSATVDISNSSAEILLIFYRSKLRGIRPGEIEKILCIIP